MPNVTLASNSPVRVLYFWSLRASFGPSEVGATNRNIALLLDARDKTRHFRLNAIGLDG